ncbi:MAG: amino acid adenylation domain-containing protein [Opitutae bacterium]|nr:amino acid adenylation domain-containing protein [Opitutae bacterium]
MSYPAASLPSVANGSDAPTLVSCFEKQAAQTPERVAVRGVNEQLTYRELDARAERLAEELRGRGVGREAKVGLFLDRTPQLVVAILAVLKAGGAYVPIDPAYPAERIAFVIADAALGVIVTEQALLRRLPASAARVVCADAPSGATANASAPRETADADSLAYVIYTSGSTGRPKGVEIAHRNVVRLFTAAAEWFRFGPDDVWTLFHSVAFDFSVWEIWGALLHGGRLVVVPYGVSRSPEDFLALLVRERVTVLNQTPSAFRALQAVAVRTAPALALRYVVFGGEALDLHSLRPWFDRFGDEQPQLVNMYGITETTVHVTVRPLTRDDVRGGSVIGVPLSDLQVHLLDVGGEPVRDGAIGELHVGGAGLARGYLNRPELTAARFVTLPTLPGVRLYRSGDLARRLPDGDLEYLGRADQQVKVRGFRIELGEIETVLAELSGVQSAVVVAREGDHGEKRLTAYIVGDPALRPGVAALREHAASRLPGYMLPAAFVPLDRLPLTVHGKVDRDALPEPARERPEIAAPYVAPRTPSERSIAAVWRNVLGLERVGIDDAFAELGGDSLDLVAVVEELRRQGRASLTVADLFQHPTVAALAAHLDAHASSELLAASAS